MVNFWKAKKYVIKILPQKASKNIIDTMYKSHAE